MYMYIANGPDSGGLSEFKKKMYRHYYFRYALGWSKANVDDVIADPVSRVVDDQRLYEDDAPVRQRR